MIELVFYLVLICLFLFCGVLCLLYFFIKKQIKIEGDISNNNEMILKFVEETKENKLLLHELRKEILNLKESLVVIKNIDSSTYQTNIRLEGFVQYFMLDFEEKLTSLNDELKMNIDEIKHFSILSNKVLNILNRKLKVKKENINQFK